jgi:hypothetical protein
MTLFVFDNFVAETELENEIRADSAFFPSPMPGENLGKHLNEFHYDQADCQAPYMFWSGWTKEEPRTSRQRLIEKVWRGTGLLPFPEDEILGFEYWTRTFLPGQFLGRHVDEDTFMYADFQWFHGPHIGCVWYGFSESSGSFLEIHESGIDEGFQKLEADNMAKFISPVDKRERIAYKPDRLVVFDAGHRLHETTPIESGIKQVIVINVWHRDQTPQGLSTEQFFYE